MSGLPSEIDDAHDILEKLESQKERYRALLMAKLEASGWLKEAKTYIDEVIDQDQIAAGRYDEFFGDQSNAPQIPDTIEALLLQDVRKDLEEDIKSS